MGNDLPDYQSQVIGVGLEATSFRSGLDTDKPASPAAGDLWLARDTYYLYVCNVAGAWEKVTKLYLLLAGGTMSGAIAMGTNKITGLDAPTANADAARKVDVDTVNAKLDDVSQAQPSRVAGTIYQNTSGKIRLITVIVESASAGLGVNGLGYCDSNSSPTTLVAQCGIPPISGYMSEGSITFIAQPNYYYKVSLAVGNLIEWTEWDLL